MDGKKHVQSFDNYDSVVRMNRHGIQTGIFQCLLERGPSDYVANEVSDLANEGNITGTIKCPLAAFPVVGNLRFKKDVDLGVRGARNLV